MGTFPGPRTRLWSWAFYDFANTIFSATVITFYFPLYLTSLTGTNRSLGMATTASMIFAGLLTPLAGAQSDQTGKTKAYLMRSTFLCVVFCALLFFTRPVGWLMLYYACACIFFHVSLVFYNALLPVAAPEGKQGFASGLGVGLGYFGVVSTLPFMNWADHTLGRPSVFLLAAVLFSLSSLPLFLFLPERTVENPQPVTLRNFWDPWKQLARTVRGLPANPKVLLFLAGNFFVVDAVNSTISWVSVYLREVFHLGQGKMVSVMMILNVCAFFGGVISGFLTDKLGAMKTFLASTVALAFMLIMMTQPIPLRIFSVLIYTCGAFAVSGVWAAGRKALVDMVPSQKIGEYFGLYGLTTKVSVIASLLYSLASDAIGMQKAMWVLVFPAAVGFFFLLWSTRMAPMKADS